MSRSRNYQRSRWPQNGWARAWRDREIAARWADVDHYDAYEATDDQPVAPVRVASAAQHPVSTPGWVFENGVLVGLNDGLRVRRYSRVSIATPGGGFSIEAYAGMPPRGKRCERST